MKRVLVALVVVAGLAAALFAADDFARTRIEVAIAEQIAEVSTIEANVQVGGLLALPQILASRLESVTIDAPAATIGGTEVTDVHVSATGVGAADPFEAEHVTATGLIPMSAVEGAYQTRMGMGGEADVALNQWRSVSDALGTEFAITFVPEVKGSAVVLRFESVTVGGREVGTTSLGWLINDASDIEIVSLDLAAGLELDQVVLTDDGVEVSLTGAGLSLADLT